MNAWITEYNLFEKEGVVAGTWAHGIYALLLSMQFMKDQRTEMICYHNLSTSAQFAAIFNSDDGFFKSVKQKPTEKFGLTAAGVSLRMFGEALKGSEAAIPLEFNGAPIINGARGKSYNALQGWNFKKKKGSAIILINLSASSQQVNLSEIAASAVKAKGIYGSPHAQIGFESDLKEVFSTGKGITLQPYSITLAEAE
jgi:hypothetical protein